MTKRKILIIGASGQGKVIYDIFRKNNQFAGFGFLDDSIELRHTKILGIPVLGNTVDLGVWKRRGFSYLFVAIGHNKTRESFQMKARKEGYSIPNAIHPSASIATHVVIGPGTAIMAGAVVSVNTTIGEGCILNTACSVDHDNILGAFSHFMPGSRLAGTIRTGKRVAVGTGAIILPNLTLVDDAVVGAGAVVTRNIHSTIARVGIPARPRATRS